MKVDEEIGRMNRMEGSTTPLGQLRTERAILVPEQLLVLWLWSVVAERALVEPALPGGQKMITNSLNDTNGIRLRPEDVTLALGVPFVAGLSLTRETGASLDIAKKRILIWVIKGKKTLFRVINWGRLNRQDSTTLGFFLAAGGLGVACSTTVLRSSVGGEVCLLDAGPSDQVRGDSSGNSRAKRLRQYSVICFIITTACIGKERFRSEAGRPVSKMLTF